jgi:hypothetical protein
LNNDPVHVAESKAILAEITDDALRAFLSGWKAGVLPVRDAETPDQGPPPSLGELLFDRLLAESRTRDSRPSRVTILVKHGPSARRPVN